MKRIFAIFMILMICIMCMLTAAAQTVVNNHRLPNEKYTNEQIFSIPWWNTYSVRFADIYGFEPNEETDNIAGYAGELVGYNIIDFYWVDIVVYWVNYDYETFTSSYFISSDLADVLSLRVKEAIPYKQADEWFIKLNYSIYNNTTNTWVKINGSDIGDIPPNGYDASVVGTIESVCIAGELVNKYLNGNERTRTALYNALPINSPGYEQLNNTDYELGYQAGVQQGQENFYNNGFESGYEVGLDEGYLDGYVQGAEDANAGNTGFPKLINAVITVPMQAVLGILNIEILGINLKAFIVGILGICLAIFVISKVLKGLSML